MQQTVSSINAFFLAMTLHPEAQAKAQAEIDDVVGTDRLPTAADRENLPYVNALFLEVLRWNNVAPLGMFQPLSSPCSGLHKSHGCSILTGVPHRLIEDDVYNGYFLPKGTIVIANIWRMLHNPETYADPMSFNPERFVKTATHEPELDPRTLSFGFGRR